MGSVNDSAESGAMTITNVSSFMGAPSTMILASTTQPVATRVMELSIVSGSGRTGAERCLRVAQEANTGRDRMGEEGMNGPASRAKSCEVAIMVGVSRVGVAGSSPGGVTTQGLGI